MSFDKSSHSPSIPPITPLDREHTSRFPAVHTPPVLSGTQQLTKQRHYMTKNSCKETAQNYVRESFIQETQAHHNPAQQPSRKAETAQGNHSSQALFRSLDEELSLFSTCTMKVKFFCLLSSRHAPPAQHRKNVGIEGQQSPWNSSPSSALSMCHTAKQKPPREYYSIFTENILWTPNTYTLGKAFRSLLHLSLLPPAHTVPGSSRKGTRAGSGALLLQTYRHFNPGNILLISAKIPGLNRNKSTSVSQTHLL